jgi:signal transduction histidine kinase
MAPMRLDTALWRAVAVFRLVTLLYAAGSMAYYLDTYRRPGLGLLVLAGMAGWSLLATWLYSDRRRRRWPLLLTDLAVTAAAVLSSVLVLHADRIAAGDPTVPVTWAAAPVLAWAVHGGWPAGLCAGALVGGAAVLERQGASQTTLNSVVLLLLVGAVTGYVVTLARRAESAYAQAVELQAVTAERERLSRQVHDGVLQALALVSRTSEQPRLAELAGEQEASLRRLVAGPSAPAPSGEADLRALLPAGPGVEMAAPASPVLLPSGVAAELAAAVRAAVDNAHQHGGRTAWLLVEDEPHAVTVSVRDDGPGIAPGRLAQAANEGRLGVARSIRGRVADLGGTVVVESAPGAGTEVELRVPR